MPTTKTSYIIADQMTRRAYGFEISQEGHNDWEIWIALDRGLGVDSLLPFVPEDWVRDRHGYIWYLHSIAHSNNEAYDRAEAIVFDMREDKKRGLRPGERLT